MCELIAQWELHTNPELEDCDSNPTTSNRIFGTKKMDASTPNTPNGTFPSFGSNEDWLLRRLCNWDCVVTAHYPLGHVKNPVVIN